MSMLVAAAVDTTPRTSPRTVEPAASPQHALPDPGSRSAQNWELVRAAQQGDPTAFGLLYDRYTSSIYRFVLPRVGDHHLAEDITSETFLRAFRRINSVSYQGRDVGAWFTTIARNIVFDHAKSGRFRLEIVTDEVVERDPSDSRLEPEQHVMKQTTSDEILRCVATLGADQRECITLRFLEGYSIAETATIMQRNLGAVKALQHRAVRRLATLLSRGWF